MDGEHSVAEKRTALKANRHLSAHLTFVSVLYPNGLLAYILKFTQVALWFGAWQTTLMPMLPKQRTTFTNGRILTSGFMFSSRATR